MRMKLHRRPERAAFTLIELLVVIAIIAVLVSLAAGAYFRVSNGQYLKRTEATLKKIHTGLASQWSAAIGQINNEVKNGAAIGDANKVNYMTTRLTQEFPVTFAQAASKYPQLAGASAATAANMQNAICLYLALTKTRSGATFSGDEVGPGSVANVPLGTASGTQSFSYFVDAWGQPITYSWTAPTTQGTVTPVVISAGPNHALGDVDDIHSDLLMKEGQRGN